MKYIALDIGNVCLKIDRTAILRELGVSTMRPDLLALGNDFECGKFDEATFVQKFAALMPECDQSPDELRRAFNAILVEPMPGMVELTAKLKGEGIGVVFFSDISTTHLAKFRELFPGAANFPGIYSFDMGAHKPSEAMFSGFERRFGAPLLYTDDRPELIEAAQKRGWNAEVFVSAAHLAETLHRLKSAN